MDRTRALILACGLPLGAALAASSASAQAVSAERGREVARLWCAHCHSTDAAPQASDVGPSFPRIAERRSPDYLRGFLANPHVRGEMPPFDLSREHIEDLIAYLGTLE
ncbi:MAG: c-type cytochrome [Tistlia sp.]|uniref:c-type cytochrome n=1 Tax=Tistlia sp. TaxID=3057121 RepID=UPI0034A23E2D